MSRNLEELSGILKNLKESGAVLCFQLKVYIEVGCNNVQSEHLEKIAG